MSASASPHTAGRISAAFHLPRFSKKNLNVVFDICSFVLFLFLTFSGVLMAFVLPRGSAGGWHSRGVELSLWDMSRHDWGELHEIAAIAFIGTIIVHLLLHRKWIWGALAGNGTNPSRRRAALTFVSISTVLLVLSVSGPFLLKPSEKPSQRGASSVQSENERDGQQQQRRQQRNQTGRHSERD